MKNGLIITFDGLVAKKENCKYICDGMGFLTLEELQTYLYSDTPLESIGREISKLDTQVKDVITSELKTLCNHIAKTRNTLITLGFSSTLLDSIDVLLTDFEDNLAELVVNS